jgi:transcriptional regulator with XRE-family HTH domain
MAKSYRTHLPTEDEKRSEKKKAEPETVLTPKYLTRQEFGRRLDNLRVVKGLSQAELGRRAGLTRMAINSYINGNSLPNPESTRKLAQVFGIEAHTLLPNYMEGAIRADHAHTEFRVSPGDSRTAWLRLDRAVPIALALKIMQLLEDNDNSETAH